MRGQRLPDGYQALPPNGAYWRDENNVWSVCTPNGRLGSLAKHRVIEHPDRTITVEPSILVYPIKAVRYTPEQRERVVELVGEEYARTWERDHPGWHGWLKQGIWTEV